MSEPTDTTSTQSSARSAAYGKVDKGDGMQWERGVLEKVAMASITEQRRARRWGIFFRFLLLAYLTTVLVLAYLPADWMDSGQLTEEPHTALVELAGVIAPGSEASAEKIIAALQKA
ncbi:MAG: S49 family peptidase, partial [Gammaproteobacteria bacterium]